MWIYTSAQNRLMIASSRSNGLLVCSENKNSLPGLCQKSIPVCHELVLNLPHGLMLPNSGPLPEHAVNLIHEDNSRGDLCCKCEESTKHSSHLLQTILRWLWTLRRWWNLLLLHLLWPSPTWFFQCQEVRTAVCLCKASEDHLWKGLVFEVGAWPTPEVILWYHPVPQYPQMWPQSHLQG